MSRCSILQTSVSTTNCSARLAITWFTDEKIFTVQTPTNSQNDRVYANIAVKRDISSERLLKGRKFFSQSLMHSVACRSWVIVISFRFTVTPSYIKDYCQTLELTLVTISLFSRMDHLLIVHEKQLLFSLFTFQTLLDSFASDYPWLSQQTEDILNITLTEISCALRKFKNFTSVNVISNAKPKCD